MRVFLTLVTLVSVGFGLFIVLSFVSEALYSREERPRRHQRAAERLAAAIASRQADSGTVITSMSAQSGPGCAGLGVCFRDEHTAFEYERDQRVRFENVDGGRVVCVNEACAPVDRGEAPVSQCALLKKFEERCGAQLAAGCDEPAGEHYFLGYAAHLKRPMFSKELQGHRRRAHPAPRASCGMSNWISAPTARTNSRSPWLPTRRRSPRTRTSPSAP